MSELLRAAVEIAISAEKETIEREAKEWQFKYEVAVVEGNSRFALKCRRERDARLMILEAMGRRVGDPNDESTV